MFWIEREQYIKTTLYEYIDREDSINTLKWEALKLIELIKQHGYSEEIESKYHQFQLARIDELLQTS